jgi:hypothetical protein
MLYRTQLKYLTGHCCTTGKTSAGAEETGIRQVQQTVLQHVEGIFQGTSKVT